MLPPSQKMRPRCVPPAAGPDAIALVPQPGMRAGGYQNVRPDNAVSRAQSTRRDMLLPYSGAVAAAATYSHSYADPYFAEPSATYVELAT